MLSIEKLIENVAIGEEKLKSFINQFEHGFRVELEHSATVHDNLITVARIVLDHLEEDMDYYIKLKKVES